mmetsp:Transcript_23008/g.45277  ORF Transcript_23008/g.45277 Transcript_23008/m.45277 type:complete len:107 (-) Transcript_23008:527-847(-)
MDAQTLQHCNARAMRILLQENIKGEKEDGDAKSKETQHRERDERTDEQREEISSKSNPLLLGITPMNEGDTFAKKELPSVSSKSDTVSSPKQLWKQPSVSFVLSAP